MAKCRVCGVCCVLIFVIFYICMDIVIADILESQIVPEPEFRRHVSVKPKIYHGREKRQISSSTEEGGTHIHDLTITYNINGTDYLLDLALNRGLLPKGYFEKYQQNGKHVINKPEGKDTNLCQYQGSLRGIIGSWAAVSTCHKGLSGVIYDGNDLHYIEKANASNVHTGFNDVHHVYKHSDLIDTNKKCGYASSTPDDHHILENNEYNKILRYKRSIDDGSTLRGPYNANKQSRYIELVLVVDQLEYKSQEENLNKVYSRCKDIANIINALYAPLNIFIALVGVVVWTEKDEIKLSENGDTTLTNFLHYRKERLVKEHPNDNAQLLTKVKFKGGVVGKALKGPICTFEYSGGVNSDHFNTVGLIANSITHAMGHNFGMEHDSPDCKCPDENCIMSHTISSQAPTHWSSCSLTSLALAFAQGMDYCLRNKPEQLFGSPVCGNGFVEPGEQCDCGLEDRCANPCCNATTCMLHSNASCATGECCDLTTCKPKSAGIMCRSADYECDLPEYCTGQSEYCPSDVYKMDTETCDNGRAFCYQGSCRTHSDQCKLLWGPSGKPSEDQCYKLNTKGSRHGNCGYNRLNQTYIKCNEEDVTCGILHCQHLNIRLEFGMESVSLLSHTFINSKGSIIPCRTAIIDLGLNQIDPGLTPNGAKCGDGKMCVNQKCMPVENIRQSIVQAPACAKNCSGNGVCNSKGHCHCNDGFAPPDCEYPGVGGSEDSGPPSVLNVTESQIEPVNEFTQHVSVKPKIYHGREKRQILSSTEEGGTHIHDLTITYNINGKDYLLDLTLNRGLLPKGYFEKYQQNGKHVINKPEGKDTNLCQYQGSLRGIIGSWAAVSTCHKGLSGVIYDGNDLHYIEKANASNVHTGFNDVHHVYKHSDLIDTNKKCGYASSTPDDHHILENNEYNRILRYKRSIDDGSTLRGPYNANKQSRYVELVLVVDQLEYKSQEENLNKVYSRCKDIANIINALYAPLNIFIALVGVVVWTETDEIKLSENGDNTLTNFLHYRRERLVKEHPNDNAQLLTQVKFEGGVVGKALKGPICTFEFSGGVSMDHSSTVGLVATTIAHEMGHNFGMEHDSADCKCPDEKCIMSPSSSSQSPKHWSSCSLAYLALAFERGMDYCLRNKPEQLFGSPVCGNGFVEPGEQCDCGLEDRCANPCCNATTCMLHSNASCATGECCDLMTCKPKSAGTVCRSADHECDLPEYCTGQSEYCPSDVYKMDTETCDSGRAFCYQGSCRTRSDQCKLLWGPSGRSSDDQCYNMNTKGSRHGNCGYNRLNQTYIKCTDENVFCGMLHCRHLNEKLEFGMESVAILSHSFINSKGSIIPCRTAIVDLGLNQIDPGLTPDGAKCGDGKMCVNQKCMTVENLRLSIAQETACSKNCGGNGVCNSKGHCHCNNGFAPPDCEYPGVGGSEDSGPASDPNALRVFMMFMYIVFLGIIPLIAISALLCYYRKHTLPSWPKGSSKTSKTAPKNHRGNLAFQSAPQIIEINSRTDDNSTLLPQSESCTLSDSSVNNDFFGHFKGFSLTPLSKPEEVQTPPSLATDASKVFNKTSDTKLVPQRSAPPVPVVPNTIIKSPKPILRSHTSYAGKPVLSVKPIISKSEPTKSNSFSNHVECAPALPPLNPGSHPRPLISSPILENSTCTAKELISPLKNAPKMPVRPAPEAPADIQLKNIQKTRPLSTIEDETSKNKPGSALNRIASFLKSQKDDKSKVISGTNSLPRNAHHVVKPVKSVIDKNSLKNIEISSPILQNEINIPSNTVDIKDNKNNIVMRAQSMRAPVDVQRPNIPNFGSMRQKSIKRPTSIPVGNRPTSPPPPRPPTSIDSEENVVINKIPGLPGYQVPQNDKKDYSYDDCVAKKSAPLADIKETSPTDNIYAVIEDSPVKKPDIISPVSNYQSPKPLESTSKSGSTESMGLLGEIVSEIQNRNFDSIYSTSTLARKKKEREREKAEKEGFSDIETDSSENKNDGTESVYDSTIYKHPDSVYCNMAQQKSSASSTTSSGYLNPSAVNVPVKNNPEIEIKNNVVKPLTMSTFKENNDTKKNIEVNSTEYKPFQSTLQRKAGPFAATFKNNTSLNKVAEKEENSANIKQINTPPRLSVKAETPSVVKSTNNHLPKTKSDTPTSIKSITRQITPPSLSARPKTETKNLTRQPTPPHLKKQSTPPKLQPTRTVPPIPRSNSKQGQLSNSDNSPDIVSSCASNTNVKKSPDVVSNNVTFDQSNKNPAKPNIVSKPVLNGDIKKPPNISSKPNVDKTTGNFKSLGGKNVASLQQKFEQNKPAVNKKTNNINNVRIKSIPLNK